MSARSLDYHHMIETIAKRCAQGIAYDVELRVQSCGLDFDPDRGSYLIEADVLTLLGDRLNDLANRMRR